MAEFDFDAAKQVVENGIGEAKSYLDDPEKMNNLLDSMKAQVADLPATVTGAFANLPTMVSMVKSYVSQEYTEVPVKTIATMVAAFIYLVKGKDIIPDNIPLLGLVDDIAVVTVALKVNEPEFEAFKQWESSRNLEQTL